MNRRDSRDSTRRRRSPSRAHREGSQTGSRRLWLLLGGGGLAVVVAIVAIVASLSRGDEPVLVERVEPLPTSTEAETATAPDREAASNVHALGPASAPVTITEFSSFL